jgi:leader peptidase (prepilin peptidase)/N-methyltransferase
VNYLFYIIFFIFGSIIGSFLNVLVLRYNTGLSFVRGKSKCFSCGVNIEWYDLIPILSYIFLGGKCRNCQSKISIQYPIVEFITGVLFVLAFYKIGEIGVVLFSVLAILSLLVAITVYDLKHKIIPDGLVFSFVGLSLFLLLFKTFLSGVWGIDFIISLLAGPALFLFFFFFWFISSGRLMGFGDAKLALGVGWFLGMVYGISAIVLAFWIGAIFSLTLLAFQKLKISGGKLTMKSEIPFAPFIIIGLLLEFFLQFDVTQSATLIEVIKNV